MKSKKLIVTLFIIIFVIFSFGSVHAADIDTTSTTTANLPSITSGAAVLMDNRTNKILYSKEENKKMYPASTTKIVTAILVLENGNLDDVVTASYNAIMTIPDGYSIANIQIGEELTVEQLLELLLVQSANDAANVLAEYIGGSVDSFVSMMNTKVNELGLTGTHFSNPYGLHEEDHYTTAYDLAMIMQYCLKNDDFRKIAGLASCAIPATNKSGTRTYTSTNELIIPGNANYYRYLTTGKTGFTTPAKECLVSSAYRDDLELICVILGSNSRFSDARLIYEYGYTNYSIENIVQEGEVATSITVSNATKDTEKLDLLVAETIPALVNNQEYENQTSLDPKFVLNENISAPIEEGEVLGTVTYQINGVNYTTNLLASHLVEESKFWIYASYGGILLIVLILLFGIFRRNKKNRI